jgi:glutathione S-transferase
MRLHSSPWSGNSYKVRLLLGLMGLKYETASYDTGAGETHRPEFLENVNPDGKVPVLETDVGGMLPESGAILTYLAEGTPYLPEDRYERAQAMRWMFFEQFSLLPNLGRPRLYRMRGVEMTPQKKAEVEGLFEMGYKALGVMERHLSGDDGGREREFFVGGRPTTADVALYAYPRLCSEGGYDLAEYPRVRAYLERIESLPGYVPVPAFEY